MEISKENFFSAGADLKISEQQIAALWNALEKQDKSSETSSPFANYLFYFGALIVISAMTWFMTMGWAVFGGIGMFLIALAYAILFTVVGTLNWNKQGLRIPSGLLITMAVCMTPLAIYGLEAYLQIWPEDYPGEYKDFYNWIKESWIFMEMGTILAGIIALRFFPFPFLTAPIFFALWFLSMDILPLIFHKTATLDERSWFTMIFGFILVVIGFQIDRKSKEDFGFWSYLFGTLSFWGGLNGLVWDKSEFILFIYLIINILLMFLSILLRRNILMICGALGVFIYLGHLAYTIFKDTLLFPFVLSIIGLVIIYLGVVYQRNREKIIKSINGKLPISFRSFFGINQ